MRVFDWPQAMDFSRPRQQLYTTFCLRKKKTNQKKSKTRGISIFYWKLSIHFNCLDEWGIFTELILNWCPVFAVKFLLTYLNWKKVDHYICIELFYSGKKGRGNRNFWKGSQIRIAILHRFKIHHFIERTGITPKTWSNLLILHDKNELMRIILCRPNRLQKITKQPIPHHRCLIDMFCLPV